MKLGEFFEVAINQGDWQKVCDVYQKITGKKIAPPAPKSLADLDMNGSVSAVPSLADTEMSTSFTPTKDEWVEEGGEDDDEPALQSPVDEKREVQQATLPPANPNRQPTVEDFRVERTSVEGESEDGRRRARREPVSVGKRANIFGDDHTIAMHESVKDHPELGVQHPMSRGARPKVDQSVLDAATGNIAALAGADTGVKVNVVCSLCAKKDKVPVALAVGWHKDPPNTPIRDRENTYKCNECQTPAGRAKLARLQRNS